MSKPKSFRNPKFFDELIGKTASPVETKTDAAGQAPEPVKSDKPETAVADQAAPATHTYALPPKKPALYKTARKATIYLEADLLARCKGAAFRRHITLSEWIEGVCRRYLAESEKN